MKCYCSILSTELIEGNFICYKPRDSILDIMTIFRIAVFIKSPLSDFVSASVSISVSVSVSAGVEKIADYGTNCPRNFFQVSRKNEKKKGKGIDLEK